MNKERKGGGEKFITVSFYFPILKIQDIAIFAMKYLKFLKSVLLMKSSQISEIGTGKFSSWTGKKTRKAQEICKWDLSGDPDYKSPLLNLVYNIRDSGSFKALS